MAKRGHFLTDAEKAKAVALYKDGKSVSEIAEALDRGWKACQTAIVEAGVYTARGAKKKPAKKKPSPKKKTVGPADAKAEEVAYLSWCMKGAVNGWLERLVNDLRSGKFA